MAPRPLPAVLFVASCLLLSGLVLRRQIAAHPRPAMDRLSGPRQGYPGQSGFPPTFPPALTGQPVDEHTWHVLKAGERESVVAPIRSQLAAFRSGDAQKAMRSQRRVPFRRFPPEEFLHRVWEQSPVFARSRDAQFGTVWADRDGQHADVRVAVRGEGGVSAAGLYEMVRQDGAYRVAGFRGGGWMPK